MNKIALGAAQFGMDYGINNKRGRIPPKEVFGILDEAVKSGIDTIDTAYDYGESEIVLGNFNKVCPSKLRIISKLPKCSHSEVRRLVASSLERLNVNAAYGYLIHSFEGYKEDEEIWNELEGLKKENKIDKIGFSFYFPHELEYVLSRGLKIDIVQVPFNLFDHRFQKYFAELKQQGTDIYVRSIFLQGLVFKKPGELGDFFKPIKDKIEQLNLLSEQEGIPVWALCFNFAAMAEPIDKIVVGVDNIMQLREIMRFQDYHTKAHSVASRFIDFIVDDERVIVPFNWNTQKVWA